MVLYCAYGDTVVGLINRLEEIADNQGSSLAEVVAQNYLSEERQRQARRDTMRNALADTFDGESQTTSSGDENQLSHDLLH